MAIDVAAAERPMARQQPLLFKRLEPLDPARHTGLKLDRAGRNYRFAQAVSVIPLTMQEFVTAGVYYPIVFSEGPQPMPLAVLGYKPGENLFVDAEGQWAAGVYIPWYVRCYPFAMLDGPPETPFVACVDAEGAGIGPLIGDLLLENNELTPMTQEILRFCHGYNRALNETRELGKVLHGSGLLAPHEATIGLGGDRKPARLTGFHAVEPKKFHELPDKTFLAWRKKGLLTAVYQHLQSLSCWPALSIAAADRPNKAAI
jgi:SapC